MFFIVFLFKKVVFLLGLGVNVILFFFFLLKVIVGGFLFKCMFIFFNLCLINLRCVNGFNASSTMIIMLYVFVVEIICWLWFLLFFVFLMILGRLSNWMWVFLYLIYWVEVKLLLVFRRRVWLWMLKFIIFGMYVSVVNLYVVVFEKIFVNFVNSVDFLMDGNFINFIR